MKNLLFIIALLSTCLTSLNAQKKADVKLSQIPDKQGLACFDIELRSKNGDFINLAGQNYRIFYNADVLGFSEKYVNSLLDKRAYSRLDIHNDIHKNIGFVSISTDGREFSDKTVKLNREGHWEKVMDICFERKEKGHYELTWAHMDKTSHIATAEIALSEWIDKRTQNVVFPNDLIDYSSKEDLKQEESNIDVMVYPNPVADYINISIKSHGEATQVIIADVIGREVAYEYIEGKTSLRYDIINWMDGLYTVEFFNNDGRRIHTQKLVKISGN